MKMVIVANEHLVTGARLAKQYFERTMEMMPERKPVLRYGRNGDEWALWHLNGVVYAKLKDSVRQGGA